ncbi:MAG: hypothetical protein J7J91_06825 [Deltaproteobacteria bacterium]|nr:hypothetical protein [Deltaproteobacteria bacterium]
MSGEEIVDVRAIAIKHLARDFQESYARWMRAWAEFQSHRKARKLLREFLDANDGVSEEDREDIEREIETEDRYAEIALEELGRNYLYLRRLEQEIARVLGRRWEWRTEPESVNAVRESEQICSE